MKISIPDLKPHRQWWLALGCDTHHFAQRLVMFRHAYAGLHEYIFPAGDGVFFGLEFRADSWDKYSTAAPAQRRQYGALSNTANTASKA